MTIAESIRAAANKLTDETWIKGSYFRNVDGRLCMCAHGALQTEVNPAVQRAVAVAKAGLTAQEAWASEASAEAAEEAAEAAEAAAEAAEAVVVASAAPVWENRPSGVRERSETYGSTEAHYVLGMVGLTASYNDETERTLPEVKAKFEEAAQLAERLGV